MSHKFIIDAGVQCDLVPQDSDLVTQLVCPKDIQHVITQAWDKKTLEHLFNTASMDTRARLHSAAGKKASLWLSNIPRDRDSFISNGRFSVSVRYLLGNPSHDNLPITCECKHDLVSDPCHINRCAVLSRHAAIPRHNQLRDVVAKYARKAGCTVTVEPHEFDKNGHRINIRPDLSIHGENELLLTDISVTNPTTHTYINGAAREKGHAAGLRDKVKYKKYKHLSSERDGVKFIPFSIETYGTLSQGAKSVILWLTNQAVNRKSMNGDAFQKDMWAAISVCLQNASAIMMMNIVAKLRLKLFKKKNTT